MIILVEDLFFDAIDNDFLVLCTKTVMTGESKNYRHVNDNPIATKEGVSNLIRKILKYERPACIYTDIYQYSNKKLKERITI